MPAGQPPSKQRRRSWTAGPKAKVVGGPCGGLLRYPNSEVKRGWSVTAKVWRFGGVEFMPLTVVCEGEWYRRVQEDGRWFYVHDPRPAGLNPLIAQAIGQQRFWLRCFGSLPTPDVPPA